MHHREHDFTRVRSDISKQSLPLHSLLLWYIDKSWNKIAHKGNPKSDYWNHSEPPSDIALSPIGLPSTGPVFSTLVILVMSSLLLLLSLEGTCWLQLAMADPPIGRTTENRMLPSVAPTGLLRGVNQLPGCSISTSMTYSRKSLSKLPWWIWGCAITGSKKDEWILERVMPRILSILLAWTSGEEEQKFGFGQHNTSVHALLTMWSMCRVSHSHCAPPHWANSDGTIYLPVFQADRKWWMVVAVRAMNVRFISSINYQSLIPICPMP